MASTNILLSEEDLRCPICMDVFTDPVATPCGHNFCRACITHCWDTGHVYKCPLCAKIFDRRPDVCVNYFVSATVQRFRTKEEYEAKTEPELQQMIQERRLKIQEVKRSVELSRKYKDRVITDRLQLFSALISSIERSRDELIDVSEEKQKATENQAGGIIEDLQQEITQLEKRISEVNQLSPPEDLFHRFESNNTEWIPSKDWTKVNVHPPLHVATLRTALSRLEKTLGQEMKTELRDAKLRRLQHYAADVTLDPDTAHPELTLSEDGKQVSDQGDGVHNLPDGTNRFDQCPCVLGRQSFSSGRFYYEVQVGGKTSWSLGVVRESIDRKGIITLTPNRGFWTLAFKAGYGCMAPAPPFVFFPVREDLQKVGVFVDYEEGLVSFYDAGTRDRLHSFAGCSFTEKLVPFFMPCFSVDGGNTAPLIISPVNMDAGLRENDRDMSPPPSKRKRLCLLQ